MQNRMTPPTINELQYLLSSGNPQMIKGALQRMCDSMEAGYRIDLRRHHSIAVSIARQKGSRDVGVRRWLYKLIGLIG
jgi:hypothetical protein